MKQLKLFLRWFFGMRWKATGDYEEWRKVAESPNWRCRRGGQEYL